MTGMDTGERRLTVEPVTRKLEITRLFDAPRERVFEADVDLSEGTTRCNCSICTKTRFRNAVVTADEF